MTRLALRASSHFVGGCSHAERRGAVGPASYHRETTGGRGLGNILELKGDGAQRRYYLDGRPLETGSTIELQVHSGRWVSGRFEWGGRPEVRPRLRARAGVNLPAQQITFVIHPHLLVRWPLVASPTPQTDEVDEVTTAALQSAGRSRL